MWGKRDSHRLSHFSSTDLAATSLEASSPICDFSASSAFFLCLLLGVDFSSCLHITAAGLEPIFFTFSLSPTLMTSHLSLFQPIFIHQTNCCWHILYLTEAPVCYYHGFHFRVTFRSSPHLFFSYCSSSLSLCLCNRYNCASLSLTALNPFLMYVPPTIHQLMLLSHVIL